MEQGMRKRVSFLAVSAVVALAALFVGMWTHTRSFGAAAADDNVLPFAVASADEEALRALTNLAGRLETLPPFAANFLESVSVHELDTSSRDEAEGWAAALQQTFTLFFAQSESKWRVERREWPGGVWHPESDLAIGTGATDIIVSFDGDVLRTTRHADGAMLQAKGEPRPNHPVPFAGVIRDAESLFLGFPYLELQGAHVTAVSGEGVDEGLGAAIVLRCVRAEPGGTEVTLDLFYVPEVDVVPLSRLTLRRGDQIFSQTTWRTETKMTLRHAGDLEGFRVPRRVEQQVTVYREDGSVLDEVARLYVLEDIAFGWLPDALFNSPLPQGGIFRDLDTGEEFAVP